MKKKYEFYFTASRKALVDGFVTVEAENEVEARELAIKAIEERDCTSELHSWLGNPEDVDINYLVEE